MSSESKKIELVNKKVTIDKIQAMIRVGSGSVCTIINENIARRVVATDKSSFCIRGAKARELRAYSNTPIPIVGKNLSYFTINDHAAKSIDIIFV